MLRKSFFVSFLRLNSFPFEYNFRSIYDSNFMVSRLETIRPKSIADCGQPEASESHLESHLCRRLETSFGFTSEQSRQTSAICRKAFRAHLDSRDAIDRSVALISDHFHPKDVFFNPQIFLVHYKTLRSRLKILNELSVRNNRIVWSESCYRTLIRESLTKVRADGFCDTNTDIVRHLLASAECEHKFREEIAREMKDIDIESMSLERMRAKVIAIYIGRKLDISSEMADRIVAQKRSRIYLTPMADIVANISVLLVDYSMPIERLIRTTSLMCVDNENLRKILIGLRRVGGHSLTDICRKYPKLLDTRFETLTNNLRLLSSKYNFSDNEISKAFLVLTLNTKVLENRLKYLRENPYFKQYQNNPRILRLALQMKSALNRLDGFKASGFDVISFDYLCGSSEYVERVMLSRESGRNGKECKRGLELFVAKYINCELDSRVRARVGRHPFERRFNYENALKVLDLFQSKDISNQQIINGLFIFLYDSSLVKYRFEQFVSGIDRKWTTDPNFLQLIIYIIEKNYGFTGNGVYVTQSAKN